MDLLLNKILKGIPSQKISEARYGEPYSSLMDDALPAFDDEDIDVERAIALSFEEEHGKGKKAIIDESSLDEDEQLARALQESMDFESPEDDEDKTIIMYRIASPYSFPAGSSSRICAGCKNEIIHGRYKICLRRDWHPRCFRCHACNQPISDSVFSKANNRPYHKSCYNSQSNLRKCDVCSRRLLSNYTTTRFWKQKYCATHDHDRTPYCCSCKRLEPRHEKYISLGDARKLCLKCLDSAIMSTAECQPLFQDIQDFYKGLNMEVTINFPMLLVVSSALNDAVDSEDAHKTHNLPEVRGLCTSQERSVPAVVRRPRRVGNLFTDIGIKSTRLGNAKVTGILVLFGYPRLLCGEILAHEMMHAWFRQNGYSSNMRDEIEEGMAEVLAHMWLKAEIKRSAFEKELGTYLKAQIETNGDRVYGGGFRACLKAVNRRGLSYTLQHIKKTGNLP